MPDTLPLNKAFARPEDTHPSGMPRWRAATALLLVATVLGACGGGGSPQPAAPQNRAPSAGAVADSSLAEGESITIDVSAFDADADALSVEALNLPDFISVTDIDDTSWQLTVAPDYEDEGVYVITLRISDPLGATGEATFTLTVTHTNRPPSLTAPAAIAVNEGDASSVTITASDPDGDALSISSGTLPGFASLIDNGDGSATLDLLPSFLASGTYIITVTVLDGSPNQVDTEIPITINNINRAPLFDPVPVVTVAEGNTAFVPLVATDPDADPISFEMDNAPTFVSATAIDGTSWQLTISPGFEDEGVYAITLRISDPLGATDQVTFTLTVTHTNRPPSLTAPADISVDEGDTSSATITASDADGDVLSISSGTLPDFVSLIDNGDGSATLDLLPGFLASGAYIITVTVSDGSPMRVDADVLITINDINRAPLLDPIPAITVAEGSTADIPLVATDPDTDPITFELENAPAFVSLQTTGGSTVLRVAPFPLDYGSYSMVIRAVDGGTPILSAEQALQITVNLEGANHVAHENAQPGTADWQLSDPALLREIEGYATATSVNRGDSISFLVSTNAPDYTLEVFRTGWYQGIGARRLLGPITVPGTVQVMPSPDPITGLVEASWVNPFAIQTSSSLQGDPWPTGVYLARLTESVAGKQSYIIFVVRDDDHQHDVLFQLPDTTYQAYNAWGGKSLYDFNSGSSEPWGATGGVRASHVSFDRPYSRNPYVPAGYGTGAGEYLTNVQPVGRIDGAGWDYNMVRWLEHEQYDVAYISNIDTHRTPAALLSTEVFLSQGHDEYWSWEMRDNVEAARNAGVDLAFFASNAAYYQTRFEPSPATSTPDRVLVVYKDELLDPVFNDLNPLNDYLTTVPFRFLPIPRPEEALIGVQYVLDPVDADIIVTDPGHWVFDKTGFINGSRLIGLLGYEPDGIFDLNLIPSREVLAQTPIVSSVDPLNTGTSHMTIYTTANASVFATGSLQWSWGLDDFNAPVLRTARVSAMAQQVSANVLENFGALPYAGNGTVSASCVRVISFADVTDDQTMAAAEFDLLTANGQTIDKTGWNVHFFDSEETVGWDHRATYAIDDDPNTFWQTAWLGAGHPHEMQIDLGATYDLSALRYTPRQDLLSLDGTVLDYEIYTSTDCASWSLVASGNDWDASHGRKLARFAP